MQQDSELIAEELSGLGHRVDDLERRLADVETVNRRLQDAALTTARALAEIQFTGTPYTRQCAAKTSQEASDT